MWQDFRHLTWRKFFNEFTTISEWIFIYVFVMLASKTFMEFSNMTWAYVSAQQERDIAHGNVTFAQNLGGSRFG